MWVLVDRTSSSYKPIEDCKELIVITKQYLPCKPHMFEKIGVNQKQLADGSFYREFHTKRWKSNIKSVEDFVKQHGTCVVSYDEDAQMLSLEIYDHYRE